MFPIRGIQLDGDLARNSVPTIRANAAPRLAGNFFSVDLQAGRAAFESVPWVRRAVVRRVWPDRLAVQLEEHRAAALWEGAEADRNADRLVNAYGEVFEANVGDVEDERLPSLAGPEGSAARCWRCTSACNRPSRRLRAERRAAAPVGPRLVACRAGQRRHGRTRPRQRRRGRGAHRTLRAHAAPRSPHAGSSRWNTPTCATPTAMRCACAA